METKKCRLCGEEKELSEFWRNVNGSKGVASRCKPCHLTYGKQWRDKHRKRLTIVFRNRTAQWRKNNPERSREIAKRCYEKNRDVLLKKKREYTLKLKLVLVKKYGGKCKCCGESRYQFLSLDHKNGGGNKDRKILGSGTRFYDWVRKMNYPKNNLQLLCYNCNMAKAFYKVCPHKVID